MSEPLPDRRGPRIAVLLLAVYWGVDMLGKWLTGDAMFPASDRVLSSIGSLLRYSLLEGSAVAASLLVLGRLCGVGLGPRAGSPPRAWRRQIAVGAALGAASFVVFTGLDSIFASLWPHAENESLRRLLSERANAGYWLVVVWFSGALVEELERAFTIRSFESAFGRRGAVAGLWLGSLAFGAGHLYQGPGAAVVAGLQGALYGWVFLRRGRYLEICVAHGVYDTIGVLLALLLYAKQP